MQRILFFIFSILAFSFNCFSQTNTYWKVENNKRINPANTIVQHGFATGELPCFSSIQVVPKYQQQQIPIAYIQNGQCSMALHQTYSSKSYV
jgi:hypothetical protein